MKNFQLLVDLGFLISKIKTSLFLQNTEDYSSQSNIRYTK